MPDIGKIKNPHFCKMKWMQSNKLFQGFNTGQKFPKIAMLIEQPSHQLIQTKLVAKFKSGLLEPQKPALNTRQNKSRLQVRRSRIPKRMIQVDGTEIRCNGRSRRLGQYFALKTSNRKDSPTTRPPPTIKNSKGIGKS